MERKVINVEGVNIRLKQLKAPSVMAFLTVYGKGVEANDFTAIEASYEQLLGWIEAEVGGVWVPVYDKMSGDSMVVALKPALADPMFMTQLVSLLEPFLARSGV